MSHDEGFKEGLVKGSSNNNFWGNDFIFEAKEDKAIFLSAPWDIIADSPEQKHYN